MLQFKDVSLSYGGTPVLKSLDFKIKPGEMVAFVGRSGAGKSSIFKLLSGEIKPQKGHIFLDDFSLDSLSKANTQRYRRQVGIVFQDFRLLPNKTAYENIAFALEVCHGHADPTRVETVLHAVNMLHRAHHFPHELSGGEAQRVAIARALVHDPRLLIADEPTGNLDSENTKDIGDIFRNLHQNFALTILFSTHDLALVKHTNPRVIRLENGVITQDAKAAPDTP